MKLEGAHPLETWDEGCLVPGSAASAGAGLWSMRASSAPFLASPSFMQRTPTVIVWVLLCALADVACAVVITLGAGLIGFGLARWMYRIPLA